MHLQRKLLEILDRDIIQLVAVQDDFLLAFLPECFQHLVSKRPAVVVELVKLELRTGRLEGIRKFRLKQFAQDLRVRRTPTADGIGHVLDVFLHRIDLDVEVDLHLRPYAVRTREAFMLTAHDADRLHRQVEGVDIVKNGDRKRRTERNPGTAETKSCFDERLTRFGLVKELADHAEDNQHHNQDATDAQNENCCRA